MIRASRVAAGALALLGSWQSAAAQTILRGTIRDSLNGQPVPGVRISVDGDSASASDSLGRFETRIEAGRHLVALWHVRYAPVLSRIEYDLEVETDSEPLNIRWPNLATLVRDRCADSGSRHTGAILGRLAAYRDDADHPAEVTAGWYNPGPASERSFSGLAVAVAPDGSFLICGIPTEREIRVLVRRGAAVERDRTVRIRSGRFAEIVL